MKQLSVLYAKIKPNSELCPFMKYNGTDATACIDVNYVLLANIVYNLI